LRNAASASAPYTEPTVAASSTVLTSKAARDSSKSSVPL